MGARYGGEEFLIVLPETGYEGGVIVAEKIRMLVSATPFATRTGERFVTASIGVASTCANGPDLSLKMDALIRRRRTSACIAASNRGAIAPWAGDSRGAGTYGDCLNLTGGDESAAGAGGLEAGPRLSAASGVGGFKTTPAVVVDGCGGARFGRGSTASQQFGVHRL